MRHERTAVIWSLGALRWSFCAYIAWLSARTFAGGWAERDLHALVLAGAEMIAVAAFLIERWALGACIALLAIFAIAAVVTALRGELPLRFLYFGATAAHIVFAQRVLARAAKSAETVATA
jgi:hypothetical protein